MERYCIGDTLVTLDAGGYELERGAYADRFLYDGPWDGDRIDLWGSWEQLTKYRKRPLLLEQDIYSVYDVDGERFLLYHWSYLRDGYGVWLDRLAQGRSDVIVFDPALQSQKRIGADWLLGVAGLNYALLMRGRPVYHASYVDVGGKAVLFAAPSGTGKSTQAALWEKHAGAEIINGDRVLLGKRNGVWHAYGYPGCGSSDICVNRTLPLSAIVVLKQGKENRVAPMTQAEKLRSLVTGMAICQWDGEQLTQALTLAEEIGEKVPMVTLVCRADEDAVRVLQAYLKGEGIC